MLFYMAIKAVFSGYCHGHSYSINNIPLHAKDEKVDSLNFSEGNQ